MAIVLQEKALPFTHNYGNYSSKIYTPNDLGTNLLINDAFA